MPGAKAGRNGKAVKKAGGSTGRSIGLIAAGVMLAAVAVLSPVAAVVALFGLLPAASAFLANWSESKATVCAIGGMNIAGVIPFLSTVWMTGGLGAATGVFELVFPLTIMYAAAAAGWLLATMMPRLADMIYNAERARNIAALRARQAGLIAEWGAGVAVSK